MSPDPPREDSGDDDNRLGGRFNGDIIEGMLDDEFIILPDAPYELDMEEESDYTDTDDDEERGVGGASSSSHHNAPPMPRTSSENPDGEEGEQGGPASEDPIVVEGQGRGRYRLLIPFPVPATDPDAATATATSQSESSPGGGSRSEMGNQRGYAGDARDDTDRDQARSAEIPSSTSGPVDLANQPSTSRSRRAEPKREIELTEEKVETIMQVMKNITLPATAIPNWAADVDEDTWKRKLYDTISTKSSKSTISASKSCSTKKDASEPDSKEEER